MRCRITKTGILVSLTIMGLLVAANTAFADRVELSLGTTAHYLRSSSAEAITDDNMAAFSLTGAVEIPWIHLPGTETLLELGFEAGAVGDRSFQTMNTDSSLLHATIGARLRRPLWSRLVLNGRAAFGAARVKVKFSDAFSAVEPISDREYAASAYLGTGLDLLLAHGRNRKHDTRYALGLRAELGYQAMAGVELFGDPESRSDDDDIIRIPAASASLSDLDLSSWTFRFGVVGRF